MNTETQSIIIDPEFAALIPPLSPEEREQLEKNLLQDGCREPLVVWAVPPDNSWTEEGVRLTDEAISDEDIESDERYLYGNEAFVVGRCGPLVLVKQRNRKDGEVGDWWTQWQLGVKAFEEDGSPADVFQVGEGKEILLDGHNRHEICRRLGIPFETTEKVFADRQEAELWIIENQVGRRNLEPIDKVPLLERKREIVADMAGNVRLANLKRGDALPEVENLPHRDEGKTRDTLAAEIGVSGKTYEALRAVATEGAEELKQAVRDKKVGASTAAEIATLPVAEQKQVIAKGEAEILREAKNIKRQRKEKRMIERKQKAAEAAKENHETTGETFRLLCGDLIEAGADIADESVDLIVTDPPYPEEFLETFSKLSALAARVLKPGGHCLVMSGQSHLPEVYRRLCENLKYQWTLNYYTPGQSTQVFGRKVKSNWKPVLWLVKGKNEWEHIADTIISDENDKRFHHWGQSVGGTAKIIELFSVPHQTVFDPFVGGGTTAVAALATGRTFIGIDLDADCVAVTAKRIKEMEAQNAA